MKKIWTKEQEELVLTGKSLRELSLELGKSEISIRHKINRLKDTGRKLATEEDENFIKKWFPIFGLDFCKRGLGLKEETINYICHKALVKFDRTACYDITDYFPNFYTPEVIYVLGLAWADGCLSKSSKNSFSLSITLKYEDGITISEMFGKQKWGHLIWNTYIHTGNSNILFGNKIEATKLITFQLSDIFFNKFLSRLDFENKSGVSARKLIDIIPENMERYFWRGYFDGDGYISYNKKSKKDMKIGFCSTYEQNWDYAEDICKILNISYAIYRSEKKNGGRGSQFLIRKKNDIKIFMDWLYVGYEKDGIGFCRKFERYKNANIIPKTKTSKVVGVCKDGKKWVAYLNREVIGRFEKEEDAIKARSLYENKIS